MRYNIEKLLAEGDRIMQDNPARDLRTAEFYQLDDRSPADKWGMAREAYLLGVAIGYRTAKAKARKKPAEGSQKQA